MKSLAYLILLFFLFVQCQSKKQHMTTSNSNENTTLTNHEASLDSFKQLSLPVEQAVEEEEMENGFIEITKLDPTILIDIKYATEDNFVKEKMYNCGRCFLRPEVAQAIVKAHKQLQTKGLGIKIFDGYRPRPFQQRLWNKVPDDRYVTNPKKGSMHNRGAAVDLTIVDKKGKELDMGTPFDFFGEKAYHTYTDLPKPVLENRALLKSTLATFGFKHIRTEWWHYSYTLKQYALSDWLWDGP
jgi:zinc D-Ala-D-Ala dipeptidase